MRGPWDAIIVGAGHNGLACAAYLARAGPRAVALDRRRPLHELVAPAALDQRDLQPRA